MLVSPSSPPPRGPPRISQVLPTVKCSNCNQPVPLNELGEHICSVAPPVPRLPPAARPPPTNPIPAPPSSTSLKPRASPPKAISISPRRPFANSGARGSNSSFQSRSSPLARSFPEESNEDYFARQASASSRDTMNSISSSSTARPSFISSGSGSSDAHGPTKSPSSPSAKSPVSPSPLAAQSNQNQRPPISSRIPEPPMSPISPLAALSNALASSSSAPALNGNGPPPSRPSFSTSQSIQDNRNMSNVPMSPRIPPTNGNRGPPTPGPNPRAGPFMASPGPSPPSPGPFRGQPPPSSRGQPSPGPGPNPNRRGPFPPSLSPGSGPNNPIQNQPPPGSRAPPLTPTPTHAMNRSIQQHEPDTKTGGEAGMAGVGRRGFAAAARAALFTNAMGGGSMGMQDRRGPFLDMDAAIAISSAGPLSSPSPVSPRPPFSTSPPSTLNAMPVPSTPSLAAGSSSTGISSGAETFFDKFRNRIPGLGLGPGSDYDPSSPGGDIPTAKGEGNGSATPRAAPSRQDSNASETSISSSSTSALTLGLSYSKSNASASSSKSKATSRRRTTIRKSSVHDDSEDSDYGGLAYADSTDDEDIKSRLSVKSGVSRRTAGNSREGATPIPGQTKGSALASSERPISGSVYSDDDDDNDLRNRLQLESSPPAKAALNRMNSNSSISSASSASSSAAAIAKALGLSKSNAEEYSVLGGPGAPGVARTPSGKSVNQAVRNRNRSATVSSSKSLRSNGSLGSGRARSGTEGSGGSRIGLTELEQAMQGLLGDVIGTPPKPRPVGIGLRDDGPSSPPHSPVTPPFFDSGSSTRGSKLAHRSNTVGVTTPYTLLTDAAEKMPKLPARSMTERGSKALHVNGYHSTSPNHEHDNGTKKKVKVCVRCEKRIEDGRWISIDGAGGDGIGRNGERGDRRERGVLCERCWKNMYLPKCRRCNLPIEKQAVSSSDGQLKGKYHKDCFNCFTCNKPFPDKVFYVYDGRPLCKYHYHEANESLCAAATCGQPIEGPCAVSHAGDRYHPEHLTCEWPGYPECDVRLNGEYWELDGRMLCEKHANRSGEDWEDESWNDERASGAQKRMTRFIDLGALGDLR